MDFHGNLPVERFGDLETTLLKLKRVKPIADAAFYRGRLVPEIVRFTDWTDQCLQELLQLYPVPADLFHVRLWDFSANAFACNLYNGGYVICLHEAIFPAFLYLSHNILLAPTVQYLLGIDQAKLPVADKGSIPNLFAMPTAPSSELREAWELMTFIGHRFIVYHEFQHLKAGHVDWLRQRASSLVLVEAASTKQTLDEDFCRTLHALEMDADSFALVHCLRDAIRMLEASDLSTDSLAGYFLRYDEALVKLVCLSIFVFFRIMDEDVLRRFDNPFERSHPNGANRITLFAASGGDYLRSSHRPATQQINWPQMCFDVLWCCEHGISHLVGVDPDIARVRPTEGYYDLLLSRWAKIRPALEQTKLAGQLAQTSQAPG